MVNYTSVEVLMDAVDKHVDDNNGRLSKLITAVSQALDKICNRPDGFLAIEVATTKTFSGNSSSVLQIDECVAITSVAVKASATDTVYEAWDSDEWLAFTGDEAFPNFNSTPYTGIMAAYGSGRRFTGAFGGDEIAWESGRIGMGMSRLRRRGAAPPTCQITARWGYADETPGVIEEACIIQASRLWKRGQASFADTLVAGEMGNLLFRVRIDQDLQLLLKDARMVRPAIG